MTSLGRCQPAVTVAAPTAARVGRSGHGGGAPPPGRDDEEQRRAPATTATVVCPLGKLGDGQRVGR